ncbi:MAG: hypothetical protein GXO43_03880 [Crenarchaeota archaeon]|nr:hypothetical protein [Thermoproteota archaeon]
MIGVGGIAEYDVLDNWEVARAKLESIGLTTIGSILTRTRMAKVELEDGSKCMVRKNTCAIHIYPPNTVNYIGPIDDISISELVKLINELSKIGLVEVIEGPKFSDNTINKINEASKNSKWYQILKIGVGWNVKVKSRIPPELIHPITNLDPIGCVMAWDYDDDNNRIDPPIVFVYNNRIKLLVGSNIDDYREVEERRKKILNAPLNWVWENRK